MQSIKLNKSSGLFFIIISFGILFSLVTIIPVSANEKKVHHPHIIFPVPSQPPKIQLAILLDTSGSMDGLIDQTRNQLWQVVNEFTSAKKNGITPSLEVALFEYGNDGNSRDTGFVRMLNNFTRELDKVSEGLFSLTTNGGSEYCGFAIKTAVHSLNWSRSNHDIKTIFIAGNEPFTQGPVYYQDAIRLAQSRGIVVNTIHAGDHRVGIDTGWEKGALMAGGDYMSIDANQESIHILAPQDKRIAELNKKLNKTYIPYGQQGRKKARRQIEQDMQSESISSALLAKRVESKSSSYYNNAKWDLVDALEEGEIEEQQLAQLDEEVLPEVMKKMDLEQRKEYVSKKSAERNKIKEEINKLSKQRSKHILKEKEKMAQKAPSMSDALSKAITKQAKEKNYQLEN